MSNAEDIAQQWWRIRARLIRYVQWLGIDFDTAEDIAGQTYDVMACRMRQGVSDGEAWAFARQNAYWLTMHEFKRAHRFVHRIQDDDGEWHPLADLLVDTREDDQHWTHIVLDSFERMTMHHVMPVPGRGFTPTRGRPTSVWKAPVTTEKGMCQRCGKPTNRTGSARYCAACSIQQRDGANHKRYE